MHTNLLRCALALALLPACGGETKTVVKNVPAEPCTIESGENGPVLVCPDGSSAPIPTGTACTLTGQAGGSFLLTCGDKSVTIPQEGCTATPGTGGAFTLNCPGGTSVTVPGPATTTLAGTALLYGEASSAGVTVSVEGTQLTGTTDASGAFSIAGVPSGLYTISFARTGWLEERFENVLVYGATRKLEVELRRTKLIQAGTSAGLLSNQQSDDPTSDDALALTIGGRGALVRGGSDSVVWLANGFGSTGFSPDGLYLAATGALWDVVAGAKIATSGSGVFQFEFSDDGSKVAYWSFGGGSKMYFRNLPGTSEVSIAGTPSRVWARGRDFYFTFSFADMWVLKNGSSTPQAIGSNLGNSTLAFTASNRAYALGTGAGSGLDLIDLDTLEAKRVIPDVSAYVASGDGQRVAYVRFDTGLNVNVLEAKDVVSSEARQVAQGTQQTANPTASALSTDGRYLLYRQAAGGGSSDWFVYDWETQAKDPLLSRSTGSAQFRGPAGHVLLIRGTELVDYTIATKNERVITANGSLGDPTPDGKWALVALDGPPRTGLLDLSKLQLTDLKVQLSSTAFSPDGSALAGIGLGEATPQLHVWTLATMSEEKIPGGADVFQFSPLGGEIVLRRIEGGDDQLLVYRRDTKELVALDVGSISILGVVEGEAFYFRRPGLGEDPAKTTGVWSVPLR